MVETFKKTFLSVESDVEGFMALVAPNCEWTIMATGEKFSGLDNIKELAMRSVAARTHTEEIKMAPTTLSPPKIISSSSTCITPSLRRIGRHLKTAPLPAQS